MRRRDLITLIGGAAALPLAARAQRPRKFPLIGVLVSASPPHPFADAFWRGLHALGYSDGENIKVEFRYTDGRSDRAEEYAEELVRLSPDVIVAHYALAVSAAMRATRTIPIVMAPHGAPLQLGIIDSLARPGGKVTGLSGMDAEIGGKRVELLRELIPNLRSIAALAATPTNPYSGPFVEDLRLGVTRAGLRFEPILIGGPSEFRSAFATMAKAEAQAVSVMPFLDPHRVILVELAAKHRLAYMSGSRDATAAGGLVSMAANFPELYERAEFFVDKILKCVNPADLPLVKSTKFLVAITKNSLTSLGSSLY